MQNEPQASLSFDPLTHPTSSPGPQAASEKKLLAPVWHTALIVALVLLNSLASGWLASTPAAARVSNTSRNIEYAATIVLELVLLFLVWIGLRLKRTKLRDLIGGRWDSVEAFLLDVALGFGVFIFAYVTLAGLSFALGMSKPSQVDEAKKLANMLAPHTWSALLLFVLLSTVAAFVEEIIFRGYLQRQIAALSGKMYVGLVVSALIFGASHGYEGARRMLLIVILGLMFGFLALWRKSLRPGMMAHAFFDSAQGVLLFVATRTGFLTGS